ncbi:hypothetical protein JCM15415_14480 [Methanobacterium movens]
MTSVLKGIFGDTKRISILEELVENWGEFLTIDEMLEFLIHLLKPLTVILMN